MKKIIISLLLITLSIGGCSLFGNDKIYTTVYPITFITDTLYSNHSDISSIYPDGTNVDEYSLSEKDKDKYSDAGIFIYNGTTKEKTFAKELINKNKNLKVIDAAYGLKYTYGKEELWLSPSNYLMLATNVKNSLTEQNNAKYQNEEIENNFNDLKEKLSKMDADIRNIAKKAQKNNSNTIVVSSNVFKFLEDYGIKVISLEDSNLENIKNEFKKGTYKYLFVKNTETTNDLISTITKNTDAQVVVVNMMNTLTEENRKNNDNYYSLMDDFIGNLKNAIN